jgi:hypothetical protein
MCEVFSFLNGLFWSSKVSLSLPQIFGKDDVRIQEDEEGVTWMGGEEVV